MSAKICPTQEWAKEILAAELMDGSPDLNTLLRACAIDQNLSITKVLDAPYGHQLQVIQGNPPEYLKLNADPFKVHVESHNNKASEVLAAGCIMAWP